MYKQLEFHKILDLLSSHALSSEAKAMVYQKQLSSDIRMVEKRLNEVEEAVNILGQKSHVPFLAIDKVDMLMDKVEKGYILTPEELVAYADFLRGARTLVSFFKKQEIIAPTLYRYSLGLKDCQSIEELIYEKVNKMDVLSTADRELQKCRQMIAKIDTDVQKALFKFLKHPANKTYIQDAIIVEKRGRQTVPIKSSFKNKVNGHVVDDSHKGLTVYVEPFSVQKLTDEKELWVNKEQDIVYRILSLLSNEIYENLAVSRSNLEIMVELDFIFARAKFSRTYDGRRVAVNTENRVILDEVRHPLILNAVPLSLSLGENQTTLVVTGVNAGGKTVVLKTVGLLTLMTMYGLLIPSGSKTSIALVDDVFVSIGDHQSIDYSLSTFSAEMRTLSEILSKVTAHSLVLLDELGSGTDPKEGTALAIAILHQLYRVGAIILTTTHYSDIKQYALEHAHFKTAAMDFDVDTLTPKYKLVMDDVGDSKAFWVAKKMGMPNTILETAEQILLTGAYPLNTISLTRTQKDCSKTESTVYHKGDIVWLKRHQQEAIFYEQEAFSSVAKVFLNHTFIEVPIQQMVLRRKATTLYPKGYNLELLFISDYKEYKFQKDLRRGSKKAWKIYRKEKGKYDKN